MHPNDEMRLVRADETVIATADYKAMMNEAAMGQVARSVVQALKEYDLAPCERGCGEMGICHGDLRPAMRKIKEAVDAFSNLEDAAS